MKCSLKAISLLVTSSILSSAAGVAQAPADAPPPGMSVPQEIAALQTEVERLKSIVPGQAVAMTQVAYNFSNLWFAVQEKNWALAQFYLNETRVRLRWAVRITPVRKIGAGELSLQPILDELEQSHLAPLREIVDAETADGFAVAYDGVLDACYGCHVASEKPYLRLTRPAQPAETLIAFGGG